MMRFGDASSFFLSDPVSLLFCFSGFYRTCRSGLYLLVYCAVWNQSVAICNIFCCLKCIAGIFVRNSFYFFEGTISFFLIDDIAGCSGNLFPERVCFPLRVLSFMDGRSRFGFTVTALETGL